jgi:surface antigen
VEFDGVYEYQCVDLVQIYNKEVINAPSLKGNAKDYAVNTQPNFYEYKINYLWYIPPRGSIAIWNDKAGGGFGHVSIVLSANLMKFTSLDQNWPTGAVVSEIEHNYINVMGFLVPRDQNVIEKYNALIDDIRQIGVRYPKI